jgi:hypothetical protein
MIAPPSSLVVIIVLVVVVLIVLVVILAVAIIVIIVNCARHWPGTTSLPVPALSMGWALSPSFPPCHLIPLVLPPSPVAQLPHALALCHHHHWLIVVFIPTGSVNDTGFIALLPLPPSSPSPLSP